MFWQFKRQEHTFMISYKLIKGSINFVGGTQLSSIPTLAHV